MTPELNRFARGVSPVVLHNIINKYMPDYEGRIDFTPARRKAANSFLSIVKIAPEKVKRDLSAYAERLSRMTDNLGQKALAAEVKDKDTFTAQSSEYDRAVWVLENEPDAFQRAENIRHSDIHYGGGRLWRLFSVQKNQKPDISPLTLEKLKSGVLDVIGGNRKVQVECFVRDRDGSDVLQAVIYSEDLPVTDLAFDDKEQLYTKIRVPVTESCVVYDPVRGELDIVSEGKERRQEIAKLFSKHVLGLEVLQDPPEKEYNLDTLAREPKFPTDPEDGIEWVKVVSLRMLNPNGNLKTTFDVGVKDTRSIYDTVNKEFGNKNPLLLGHVVKHAKIVVRFAPTERNPRGKNIPIKISAPNSCDLKNRTEEEKIICGKYLLRWKLVKE